MRIGLATGEYPPMQGGVGAYTEQLALALAAQGHEIGVYTSEAASAPSTRAGASARVQVYARAARWTPGAVSALRQWVRDERLDVLNIEFQTAAYGMSPFVHFIPDVIRDVPVVTTFHDLKFPYLFPKAGPLRDWIVMHLARRSAGVIATNHEDLARLSRLPNATLIPIGSNVQAALPVGYDRATQRAALGAGVNDFVIAYFGFINRSKGVHRLIESLGALRSEGLPARLVMIGGRTGASDPTNAAYADEIDRHIAALDLGAFVHWTGFVDAVSPYLCAADGIALPFLDGASYRRGSLMAALEHGCAIVTTEPQVAIPTFRQDESMLLVKADAADALTAALRRVYQSPDLAARLRDGARTLAAAFAWDRIAADHLAFYRHMIRG